MEKIYGAMLGIAKDLSEVGLAKTDKNDFQGFMYRGIDALMNVLSPILVKNSVIILPTVTDVQRELTETTKGKATMSTVLRIDYKFISTEDGSSLTVSIACEAMDTGDKSIGKAISYGYKSALFTSLCIPLQGGMEDPDATCYDRAPKKAEKFDPVKLPDNPTGADEVPFDVSGEDDVPFPVNKTPLKKRTK